MQVACFILGACIVRSPTWRPAYPHRPSHGPRWQLPHSQAHDLMSVQRQHALQSSSSPPPQAAGAGELALSGNDLSNEEIMAQLLSHTSLDSLQQQQGASQDGLSYVGSVGQKELAEQHQAQVGFCRQPLSWASSL